jgi:hypothetical protein
MIGVLPGIKVKWVNIYKNYTLWRQKQP